MGNYDLNQTEQETCERQAIISTFMDIVPSQNPKAVFVLAQPGAGKTGLTGFCKLEFDNRVGETILHIDPDRVGIFHKYYSEIMSGKQEDTYAQLQRFTAPALKKINALAIDKSVNILTEGTFRDTEGYLALLNNLMRKNYEIEINMMAVDSLESMLSSMERYYKMIDLSLPPRNVEKKYHDSAYYRMLDTLRVVEEKGMFSRIRIFTRGKEEREPNLYFSKTREDKHLSAVEFMQSARQSERRKIIINETSFGQRLEQVKRKAMQNGNEQHQIEQILAIEEEFQKELLKGKGEK